MFLWAVRKEVNESENKEVGMCINIKLISSL